MATVKQSFVDSYLNNKLLESVKSLNQVLDALDESKEKELVAQIDDIIKRILDVDLR